MGVEDAAPAVCNLPEIPFGSCTEGVAATASGASCTPMRSTGYTASATTPLVCTDGTLVPATFSCVEDVAPAVCNLPEIPFGSCTEGVAATASGASCTPM